MIRKGQEGRKGQAQEKGRGMRREKRQEGKERGTKGGSDWREGSSRKRGRAWKMRDFRHVHPKSRFMASFHRKILTCVMWGGVSTG